MSNPPGDSFRDVVDEVRALRAEVSRETSGFEHIGEYLRRVREEYLNRTGRFTALPREPIECVEKAIASASDAQAAAPLDKVRGH